MYLKQDKQHQLRVWLAKRSPVNFNLVFSRGIVSACTVNIVIV